MKNAEDHRSRKIFSHRQQLAGRFLYCCEKKIEGVKRDDAQNLKHMGESFLADCDPQNTLPDKLLYKRYAEKWIRMYDEYQADPLLNDRLFFNAPAVIIVTAQSAMSGGLASSNMELMANALGLGALFSGYFVRAARANKEIFEFLEVQKDKDIISCIVIGYPDVRYLRTVPRKKADIKWK